MQTSWATAAAGLITAKFFFIVGDSWLLVLCSWELMTGGALSLVMEAHDGWDSVCSGGLMAWLIVALWIKK